MDPVVQTILLCVVLPAVAFSLAGSGVMLLLRKQFRVVPAAITAIVYIAVYFFYASPIGALSPETWHILFSGAILAGVCGIIVELLGTRWQYRVPAYLIAALACALWAMPRPHGGNPHLLAYIAATFITSASWLLVLRLPARSYPAVVPLAALCIMTLIFGASLMLGGNMRQGGHAMALSVPLGAMATAALFKKLRPIVAAALTPACLALPSLMAMAFFYNEPEQPIPPTFFYLAGAAPLAVAIGLIPLKSHKWIAPVAGLIASAGIAAFAGKIASDGSAAITPSYKTDSGVQIERSTPKQLPPGSSFK